MKEIIVLGMEVEKKNDGWYKIFSHTKPYVLNPNNFVVKNNKIICLKNNQELKNCDFYQISIPVGYGKVIKKNVELVIVDESDEFGKFTAFCSNKMFEANEKLAIDSIKRLASQNRPDDFIKKVIFNEKAKSTTVIWKDDLVTTVRCNEEDEFNKEVGIALCYMKRCNENRSCFNEVFRKWCN